MQVLFERGLWVFGPDFESIEFTSRWFILAILKLTSKQLNELWQETFRQELTSEQQVVIATNKFKPDNIIVGQGYIASQSKQEAIDWLKIIRTALIFVEENKEDLKQNLKGIDEPKPPEVRDDYDIPDNFENFWD